MAPSNIIVDPKLLGEVALSIHFFSTKGETPLWWRDHSALVEYGIARFVDKNDAIKIEEPLVLVAISRFFEGTPYNLHETVKTRLQHDPGKALEAMVLLTMSKLFENKTKLSDVLHFHGDKPSWADLHAQVVIPKASGGYFPFSIDHPFDPASIVAYSEKDPEAVVRWLEASEAGWCCPGNMMGPDLMVRLQLEGGRILLVVIQVKYRSSGNKDGSLGADVTTAAIESLIPSNFFSSLVRYQLISSYMFIDFHCCR